MPAGLGIRKIADLSAELADIESFDDLCRQAVLRGREVIGVDRVGVWFATDEPLVAEGSFGINEHGELRDERGVRVRCAPSSPMGQVMAAGDEVVLAEKVPLRDEQAREVGVGTHLLAALWDGRRVIGCLAADDLLSGGGIDEEKLGLMRLYAILLGPLFTRKRTQIEVGALREELGRFRALVDGSDVMVFLWGLADGFPIEYASHSVRLLGYHPEDFTSGRVSWVGITHPNDCERLSSEVTHHLAEAHDQWTQHYRLRDASGTYRWIEDWNRVIRSPEGEATHIQGVLVDASARHELEQKLHDVQERSYERLGHALHDSLGQELTGISFLAKSLSQKLEACCSQESEAAAKLARLAADAVKQTRRISHGLTPVDLSEIGLADSLHALLESMDALYGAEGVFEVDPDVVIDDRSVALHLYHTAQEAIHNAARHGQPAQIRVQLHREAGETVLVVIDDGCGFVRGAKSDGCGLRLMRHRMEMIDGTLVVKSVPGEGTTVTCRGSW